MINFLLLFLISVSNLCQGEQPLTICSSLHPFKTKENSCASFTEICVKRGDEECDNIQNACSQCPPSNNTFLILREILLVRENLTSINLKIENLTENLTSINLKIENLTVSLKNFQNQLNKSNVSSKSFGIVLIILICILLLLVLLLVVKWRKTGYKKRKKYINDKDYFTKKQLLNKETQKELIKESMEDFLKDSKYFNAPNLKTKFQIKGTSSVIELCIHEDDNIVKIKKQICSKWAEAKPHFIKIMKLSYEGRIFDDNQYLLSNGISKFETITCDLDHSINHGSILILKIHGNQDMPEYIQVHNYQTISNIKEIFANLYNLTDLVILKDLNKYEILNDKSTIKECSLMDEDWIKVVKREKGKITIRSIFEENESLVVEYSNTDQVSSIKKSVVNKFQSNPDNFVLFLNNQHLPEDKYIFDLNIKNENALRFCLLLSSKTLEYDSKTPFETGYFSDLFEAKDQMTERELIIKRYNKLLFSNLKDNQIFLNELVTCLITKSQPRFIQLYNVFKEDDFFFIAEEKITGGSIRKYSKDNYPLLEKEIIRLSKQILEGLQYLHSNGIIFRDLKASNILLDTNKNLKLPGFSFSKYVYADNPIISSKETPFRYVAPEILRKEKCDSKADVWSFGIILVELVSGDKPLPNLTEIQARELILKGEKVEFKCFEGMSATLKSFINSCIKSDPKERRTIEKLIQDRF